jgi:3',5'-cyclic AMP phosphodiesterase CpdA
MLSLAILSDLHFSSPTFRFADFCSKKWLGNLNALLFRSSHYSQKNLHSLLPIWQSLHIRHLLVTGDISSTSSDTEFTEAKNFFLEAEKLGITPILLPGNHDVYTKKAETQKLFYQYFPSKPAYGSLEEEKVAVYNLSENLFLITLDVSKPTLWISSRGYFTPSIEASLRKYLSQIPKEAKIIIASHYPLLQESSYRKKLVKKEALLSLIQELPQYKIYIHGHTHKHVVQDLREQNLPIILGLGSVSHTQRGNWMVLQEKEKALIATSYKWAQNSWQPSLHHTFGL